MSDAIFLMKPSLKKLSMKMKLYSLSFLKRERERNFANFSDRPAFLSFSGLKKVKKRSGNIGKRSRYVHNHASKTKESLYLSLIFLQPVFHLYPKLSIKT
jgi:hypothetical protein